PCAAPEAPAVPGPEATPPRPIGPRPLPRPADAAPMPAAPAVRPGAAPEPGRRPNSPRRPALPSPGAPSGPRADRRWRLRVAAFRPITAGRHSAATTAAASHQAIPACTRPIRTSTPHRASGTDQRRSGEGLTAFGAPVGRGLPSPVLGVGPVGGVVGTGLA